MKKQKLLYPLHQSPLYKLKNKRKLAKLFYLPIKKLESLAERGDNYNLFQIKELEKIRIIEEPKHSLNKIHKILFKLITSIESPEYLQSGIKGRSYISNAKKHIGNFTLIKLDIEKFYPSTTFKHIYTFFHHKMQCSPDVATILSKLCSYQGHLPTGSCLSQSLAFYTHIDMFEKLNNLAREHNLTMTCYVDDIAFSGKNCTLKILNEARLIIRKNKLKSKPDKERFYKNDIKLITGVITTHSEIKLPNRRHKIIHEELKLLNQISENEKNKLKSKLRSRLYAAGQIEETYLTKARMI